MRFQSYFNHAVSIIAGYDGKIPLSPYLKQYFAANKKHGSTDRKMIAHACYSYYRLGHSLKEQPASERLKAALFLCTADLEKWSVLFEGEEWGIGEVQTSAKTQPMEEHRQMGGSHDLTDRLTRIKTLYPSFAVEDIFPWKNQLSEGIDHYSFCLSFLRQPDLFLRIRPGHEKEVLQKLEGQQAEFIPPFTLRLPNGFKTGTFFTPDREIVVQDYSSQRLAPFLQLPETDLSASMRPSIWDACAGSGGKSILAYDLNPNIKLTVSDIRESILHNLGQRFQVAGIKNVHSFAADLTRANPTAQPFDLILADVPCTGSGTWSRTPEELFFFDPVKIDVYRNMQEKIVSQLIPHLGKNVFFVYSTCSVFKKENEEMAAFIQESLGSPPDRMETIKGVEKKADSMFAVRFTS